MNDNIIKLSLQQLIKLLDNFMVIFRGEQVFFSSIYEICKWGDKEHITIFTVEELNQCNIIFDKKRNSIIINTFPKQTEFFVFRKASAKDIQKII